MAIFAHVTNRPKITQKRGKTAEFWEKLHKKYTKISLQNSVFHMARNYINSSQDLTSFLFSSSDSPKSCPVAGCPGLTIVKKGARWDFSLTHEGSRYHATFGTFPDISLKEAKAQYLKKRLDIVSGVAKKPTPRKLSLDAVTKLAAKTRAKAQATSSAVPSTVVTPVVVTFDQIKCAYFQFRLEQLEAKGTNKLPAKSVGRMEYLFDKYAQPIIGNLPVAEIANSHIIQILSSVSSDTSRIKLKAVLSLLIKWLVQQNLLNPDSLNINWPVINSLAPRDTKAAQNYPRVAVPDIPHFFAYALKPRTNFRDSLIGLSLVLVTLTAQRAGTIFCPDTAPDGDRADLFCHWHNVDFESAVLTIPASHMKISQINGCALPPFRVPLCKEAIWCLNSIKTLWRGIGIELQSHDFLVPQYDDPTYPQKAFSLRHFIAKTLHPESLAETGKGFFDPDQENRVATTHGLRSSFADWAATNGYSEDLIEKALAHTMPKVQRAYRRDDLVETRRPMMDAWGEYCFSQLPFKI